MADTAKIIAQSNPSAATLTTIYTVASSTQVVLSSLMIANRSAVATSFRIAFAVAGAADNNKQYIYYDVIIPGNDTFAAVIGVTLAATDEIRVYATLATLSFGFFGIEIT